MPRVYPLRAIALVAFAMLAALPLASATAAPPTFHDRFGETVPGVNICGVIGTVDVTVNQVGWVSDTSFKVTGQSNVIFTADDGRTASLKTGGQVTGSVTENADGTLTFVTTFKGLPEQISSHGKGGVELRDAGIITFITTIDPSTGDVLSREIGRHQGAASRG
ncbi:MAG: hypothetical protein C4346_14555 [Chloroflexota bacterium]